MYINKLIAAFKTRPFQAYSKLATSLIALFIIIFSVQSYRGTKLAVDMLSTKYQSQDSILKVATAQDEIFAILKKQAFLQANLEQAESHSIGLSINLVDSTISLKLKGVELHGSKILAFSKSKIFNKMNRASLINMLGSTLLISADSSNIVKEPIKTVKAPKNEEEAALQLSQHSPDTIQENVVIRIVLDNSIVVLIEQNPDSVGRDMKSYTGFLTDIKREKSREMWKSLIMFDAPSYEPWIKIYLPAEEAKSIYRALPANGNVILKI